MTCILSICTKKMFWQTNMAVMTSYEAVCAWSCPENGIKHE